MQDCAKNDLMGISSDNPVICDASPCPFTALLAASSPGEDQAVVAAHQAGVMVSAISPTSNVVNDSKVVIFAHIEPAVVGINSSPTGTSTQEPHSSLAGASHAGSYSSLYPSAWRAGVLGCSFKGNCHLPSERARVTAARLRGVLSPDNLVADELISPRSSLRLDMAWSGSQMI